MYSTPWDHSLRNYKGNSKLVKSRLLQISFQLLKNCSIFLCSHCTSRPKMKFGADFDKYFTYSKCPNSIQLVVFCSHAISEYTCGPQQPLYHPSFYCISLSLSPPLSPWYWDMQPEYIFQNADLSNYFWPKCLFQPMQFPVSRNEKVFRQLGATPGPFSPKASILAKQQLVDTWF